MGGAQWRNLLLVFARRKVAACAMFALRTALPKGKVREFSTALRPPLHLRSGRNDRFFMMTRGALEILFAALALFP